MKPEVLIRVVGEHEDNEWDYHQWVTSGERMKVDRLCRSNPRIYFSNATKWLCNGCPAWAIVRDTYIEQMLGMMDSSGLSRMKDLRGTIERLPRPSPGLRLV